MRVWDCRIWGLKFLLVWASEFFGAEAFVFEFWVYTGDGNRIKFSRVHTLADDYDEHVNGRQALTKPEALLDFSAGNRCIHHIELWAVSVLK